MARRTIPSSEVAPRANDAAYEGGAPTPRGDIRSARPLFLSGSSVKAYARRVASVAALVVLDLAGIALGLYLALTLRELYLGRTPLWGLLWKAETTWLPFVTLVTLLVFWQRGLYAPRERRAGFGRVVSSLLVVAVLTVVFGLGIGHEFNTYAFAPTAVVLATAFVGLFRASYEEATGALLRAAGVRRRALLVGEGDEVNGVYRALGSSRGGIDYDFVGAVAAAREGVELPVLGPVHELPRILDAGAIDELIIAHADVSDRQLLDMVDHAHRRGVQVRVAPKTLQLLTQRVDYVPGQAVPLFELRPPVFAGVDWVVKRSFDVLVSAALLVAGLPLWVLIALAVKLSSPGPVLYRDPRVGLNEREFWMLKFRTMYVDAPERQDELEQVNQADGALFKMRDDPRVTRVGALLRRFSLDEIPQLVNVLRREMSLVGPRPLPLRDYRRLEAWHRKRYLVLPGMTGLWQISGRSDLGFDELVRLDFYYIEDWSIWLDISILVKTIPVVLARSGAY